MFNDNDSNLTLGRIEIDAAKFDNKPDMHHLPVLPTRNLVLFPGVVIPIALGRDASAKLARQANHDATPIGVVCQLKDDVEDPDYSDLFGYGVIADVLKVFTLPDGNETALLKARGKFVINSGSREGDFIYVSARRVTDRSTDSPEYRITVDGIREMALKLADEAHSSHTDEIKANMQSYSDGQGLVNYLSTVLPLETDEKMQLLSRNSIMTRATDLLRCLMDKIEKVRLATEIMIKAKGNMDQHNRTAFLQQQMDTIREELYGSLDDTDELVRRADEAALPEAARKAFDKELTKLRRLNPQSPDYAVSYSYLENVLDLPWGRESESTSDFDSARAILESDHYGLEKVKNRILEQLALLVNNPGGKSPIICLVGPPGVGKTSLGKSVANALGRKYQRVSLGGLHDEAEIRGHRRTYIGAMPGRIIEAIKRAGTDNPVLLLDEIDKIGRDFKGDPESALLEVLDPEQNKFFHDNYIDIDYDLSHVLFIATANTLGNLQQPLLDRMEVIDLSGYLLEEKVEIAKRHLLPQVLSEYNLTANDLRIADDAYMQIIDRYTAESGVRQLEKKIASLGRKAVLAKVSHADDFPDMVRADDLERLLGIPLYNKDKYEGNDFAGVVTGLAWTQAGGEILLVEVSLAPGKGDRLTVTGNLGDVMKESASIAMQWVKAHADECGIDPAMFEQRNVHIHFPEGAIPKDGPSAGITMVTALVSAFTGRRVNERVAMTGEITLRGRVLPVGGIKEKILSAKRAGIKHIILSAENRKDVEDIPARYRDGLDFRYVETVSDVIREALSTETARYR